MNLALLLAMTLCFELPSCRFMFGSAVHWDQAAMQRETKLAALGQGRSSC